VSRAAGRFTAGMAAVGTGPAVVTFTKGVLKTMILTTLFKVAAAVVVTGLLATGAGAVAFQVRESGQESPTTAPGAKSAGTARPAVSPKSEAETIAETFLKAGSKLFNAKDAAALAATYTEDGEIVLVGKKDGEITKEVKKGRTDIEEFYSNHFQATEMIDSENTVELARLIAPDVLVVHGRFRPNAGQAELPFVQMRVKRGDRWLLSRLWLFLSPGA